MCIRDSLIELRIQHSNGVLPSLPITCHSSSFEHQIIWPKVTDSFRVTINWGQPFITSENRIFVSGTGFGSNFSVKVQPLSECDYLPSEITCLNPTITSTNNSKIKQEIKVFPNPTSSEITIQTHLKVEEVEVFDISGKKVGIFEKTNFSLPSKFAGIFFLKIKTPLGHSFKKVILNP